MDKYQDFLIHQLPPLSPELRSQLGAREVEVGTPQCGGAVQPMSPHIPRLAIFPKVADKPMGDGTMAEQTNTIEQPDEILEMVIKAVRYTGMNPAVGEMALDESTHLYDVLKFDFLDVIELTVEIEETCDVQITDAVMETFETIGDVVRTVKSLKGIV